MNLPPLPQSRIWTGRNGSTVRLGDARRGGQRDCATGSASSTSSVFSGSEEETIIPGGGGMSAMASKKISVGNKVAWEICVLIALPL